MVIYVAAFLKLIYKFLLGYRVYLYSVLVNIVTDFHTGYHSLRSH